MTPDTAKGGEPQPRPFRSFVAMAVGAVALLALAGGLLLRTPAGSNVSLVGGPFALQDGAGRTITSDSLRGRPFLVYFGYTHCPDVCPTELAHIADVLTKMGNKAIPALFITVDPERDTPKVMQDYSSSFGPGIVGLSGGPQAVGAAMRAFRVFARKGPIQSDGGYAMDHSSIVYLMDKTGRFVEALKVERAPEDVAAELASYL